MILITRVETIETDKDFATIQSLAFSPTPYDCVQIGSKHIDQTVLTEIVRGRRYINKKRNIDVVIGISNEAGKLIGLMYDSLDDMEIQINMLRSDCEVLDKKLTDIKNYSFFDRLAFLLGLKKIKI